MAANKNDVGVRLDGPSADHYRDPRRAALDAELLWLKVWQMACRDPS